MQNPAITYLLTALLLLMLNGCSPPVRIESYSVSDRLVQMALTQEAAGNYQGAVDFYLRAAAAATGRQHQDILLQATTSLIQLGEYKRATAILDTITASELSHGLRERYDINRAEIALNRNHTERVLALLQTPPAAGPARLDYHRVRAEAYQRNRDYRASILESIRLDPLLDDPVMRLANQSAIWVALARLTDTELQHLRTTPPPDPLGGWAELAQLARVYRAQSGELSDIILQWQMRHPDHPANGEFTDKLAGGIRIEGQAPQQVALLLPLSGNLATVAATVRDGVLAAYNDMPGEHRRPVMKIYDVGADPASVLDNYRKAVSDGAEFVIGPLRKESVQILASREQLPVPVLALNHVGTDSLFNPSLYEFGLSPEDDAREVARRAWNDGHRRAIALIPQGSWGERVYTAYLEQWQQLGGQLLDMQRYNPDEPDHGQDIRAALALDSSEARHQRLERLLDREIGFEPRRRRDIDYIFVLATPVQGRLIRPQLDFYRAVNVPVYATSHVYTGHPDKAPDADMNGLIFCDIPWILDSDVRREHMHTLENTAWTESATLHSRFYALGIDAWHLIPYVDQSGSNDREAYQGVTGELTLDSRQRIHRRLRWARFQNGLPVPLEATASNADMRHALSRAATGHAVRPAPSGMSVIREVRGTDRGDR